MKALLLYTMTSGLGDFIVMGDLINKLESFDSNLKCLIAHRGNSHVVLWNYSSQRRFFDVYNPSQLLRLISTLRVFKKNGFTVFGIQMAPGSVQGFLFYLILKKIKVVDFIVDFNLINADIITPPRGNYILDLHLNQVEDLLGIKIPKTFYHLSLPINVNLPSEKKNDPFYYIGIHPWSRRGHLSCFVWPFKYWLKVIRFLLQNKKNRVVIFGKDKGFDKFRNYVTSNIDDSINQVLFTPSGSVKELIETINRLDLVLSVNTSVVHIGYALNKNMIILCGPSLDLWTPKSENILVIYDKKSKFAGSDKCIDDDRFPSITRITPESVICALESMLPY